MADVTADAQMALVWRDLEGYHAVNYMFADVEPAALEQASGLHGP